jgi:SAM-dependent methyltransferase
VPAEVPYPPFVLANRVGSIEAADDPWALYEELGRGARASIVGALPEGWTWEGRTVLDFGCGAGRTLRHFLPEAESAEVWGCDIDPESIAWLEATLSPPLKVFVNGPEPPLPQPDATFDLIWVVSVFTHLVESWSSWLLELRRVLKPGGILVATFMSEALSEPIAGEQWDEDRFGMNAIRYGQSWDLGGPMVLHSSWWIEEHWGRAFEMLEVAPRGFAGRLQGVAVMRRDERDVTREELERIDPGEPRELLALQHNIGQLRKETADLRRDLTWEQGERAALQAQYDTLAQSRSWQLTRPLRQAAERARGARRGSG